MARKILLVDDEKTEICLVQNLLEKNGYQVAIAESGEEALAAVKQEPPDLILTDIVMPGMGGFGLFKELSQDDATRAIPLLVITARGKMKETLEVVGVQHIIIKPIQSEELLNKIHELLGDAPPEAPSDAATTASDQEKAAAVTDQPSPAAEPVAPTTAEAAAPSEPAPKTSSPGRKRVVLAGETKAILENMEAQLAQKKCQAMIISQAKEIVPKIMEFNPDIIILDVRMEGLAAKDIIRRMRRTPGLKEKKIVTFSYLDKKNMGDLAIHQATLDIEGARSACMEAGANGFLGFFEEAKFLSAVEKFLNS